MNKPPAFQFYAKDWIADTARLTLELEGAYIRLLCHQWNEGPLPDDPQDLAEILGVTRKRFRRLWGRLTRYFPEVSPGRVANERLEAERQKQAEYRALQAERGREGGKRRSSGGLASAKPEGSRIEAGSQPDSSSASTSTFAGTSSVLRTEATPRTDLSRLMGTLRVTGYAPDGQPPAPDDPARDGSVFKALLKGGRSVDDLVDALRGVRAVADRQLALPEGDTPWLAPFAKFTARWLYNTKWGSRPLADVARDVWRKGKGRKDRGGPATDVASIVGRVA